MKKQRFHDLDEKALNAERAAVEQRAHLKLVRNAIAGGETGADAETARLARDLADLTDGVSLTATDLKLPFHLRAFVDAVIGACGGSLEWVEITDKALAMRMG